MSFWELKETVQLMDDMSIWAGGKFFRTVWYLGTCVSKVTCKEVKDVDADGLISQTLYIEALTFTFGDMALKR